MRYIINLKKLVFLIYLFIYLFYIYYYIYCNNICNKEEKQNENIKKKHKSKLYLNFRFNSYTIINNETRKTVFSISIN